jgi:hypothetical protein
MMMLNPPTLIDHNNDCAMNGTSLRCSPPKSSNLHFDEKIGLDFVRNDLNIR